MRLYWLYWLARPWHHMPSRWNRLLSCLPEMCVLPVGRPPSWIVHFRISGTHRFMGPERKGSTPINGIWLLSDLLDNLCVLSLCNSTLLLSCFRSSGMGYQRMNSNLKCFQSIKTFSLTLLTPCQFLKELWGTRRFFRSGKIAQHNSYVFNSP